MFVLILEQLVKMFFIMLLAFICYKIRLVNQEGNRIMSDLLLMVVNPCLILTVFQTEYSPELARGLMLAFAAAVMTHVIGILVTTFLIRPRSGDDYGVERFNAMYSNCGFIGIPLIGSVLGDTGVFYLSAYLVVFNLLTWTHGVGIMEKRFSLKNIKKGILSPMFIATAAAAVLFFMQFRIPSVLLDSINYIADMNTPLAMMVAGFSVAQADLPKMLRNMRLYVVSAFKLLLIPLLTIPVLMLMHLPQTVSLTTVIAAACPAATTGTMLAIRYRQNYTYSSEIFAMSTVFSIVTMPVVVMLAEQLL